MAKNSLMKKWQFQLVKYGSFTAVLLYTGCMSLLAQYLYGDDPTTTFEKMGKFILGLVNVIPTVTMIYFIMRNNYEKYVTRKMKELKN